MFREQNSVGTFYWSPGKLLLKYIHITLAAIIYFFKKAHGKRNDVSERSQRFKPVGTEIASDARLVFPLSTA